MSRKLPLAQTSDLCHQGRVQALRVDIPGVSGGTQWDSITPPRVKTQHVIFLALKT